MRHQHPRNFPSSLSIQTSRHEPIILLAHHDPPITLSYLPALFHCLINFSPTTLNLSTFVAVKLNPITLCLEIVNHVFQPFDTRSTPRTLVKQLRKPSSRAIQSAISDSRFRIFRSNFNRVVCLQSVLKRVLLIDLHFNSCSVDGKRQL